MNDSQREGLRLFEVLLFVRLFHTPGGLCIIITLAVVHFVISRPMYKEVFRPYV
jgi:hypothetical protein